MTVCGALQASIRQQREWKQKEQHWQQKLEALQSRETENIIEANVLDSQNYHQRTIQAHPQAPPAPVMTSMSNIRGYYGHEEDHECGGDGNSSVPAPYSITTTPSSNSSSCSRMDVPSFTDTNWHAPLDVTRSVKNTNRAKKTATMPVMSLADLGFRIPNLIKPQLPQQQEFKDNNSSSNVRNLLSYQLQPSPATVLRAADIVDTELRAPYATEKQKLDERAIHKCQLEKQLLALNMEKEQLSAEYTKLEQMHGRTMDARKRKASIEVKFRVLEKEIGQLRLRLR
jgi:hypothetical protein